MKRVTIKVEIVNHIREKMNYLIRVSLELM